MLRLGRTGGDDVRQERPFARQFLGFDFAAWGRPVILVYVLGIALLVVSGAVLGIAYGGLQNLTLLLSFAAVERGRYGTASAVWNIGFDLGTALGSVLIGAIAAGADFIKTSTGKIQPAATLPVTLIMLEAVRDWRELTGEMVGVKPAGGIRTTKDAVKYLVMVSEVAGNDWLDPDWFRFGASSLLGDLQLQRQKLATGAYSGPDYVTID